MANNGAIHNLTIPIAKDQITKTPVARVREEYRKLATDYEKFTTNKIITCPKCGNIYPRNYFYTSPNFIAGYFPICKSCLMDMVMQIDDDKTAVPNETKKSVQHVLDLMNLPYDDDLYNKCCSGVKEDKSPFVRYITIILSLPKYKGKKYKDSQFGSDDEDEQSYDKNMIAKGRKNFGNYPDSDLMFLQEEYEDWTTKYDVHTKGQSELFKQLCFIQLQLNQARKTGEDTKDLIKQYMDVMTKLGISPNQSNSDQLINSKSFGQQIEYWEDEYKGGRPIPEASPEFQDINHIKEIVDVMAGTLAESSDIKNSYTKAYDDFMKKYTVQIPHKNDAQSRQIRDKLFGKSLEDTEQDINGNGDE